VTAPRPLLEKVDQYVSSLRKALYQQVSIEAKIIEVYLQDNSRIGLDWSSVLKNFSINGTTYFGTAGSGGDGQVYPWIETKGDIESATRFVSKVALTPASFSVMLNALKEQGDTHVLANPKLTVLNGQPAIISVGKDIAYIRTVTKDVDTDTNEITYTAEVDNVVQGIALGVMASIVDGKKVILHLTPITTDLIGDEVPYRTFGDEGLEVGLPQVSIREMSTMVEVENGEMLVIGGLIDNVEQNTGNFAPVVGSIPIVKYLFGVEEKIKQKRELVILLTPKII
jgi:general secretion pathway protein D/MSHA biogenesis protein MshL